MSDPVQLFHTCQYEVLFRDEPEWLEKAHAVAGRCRELSQLLVVTGPSRTADIELTLTLGVHGPGKVIVVIGPEEPPR